MNSTTSSILALILIGLLWFGAGRCRETHDDAFTAETLTAANAADLQCTVVTPHLQFPLQSAVGTQQNVLWCSSFQLAWNELCGLVREDVTLRHSGHAAGSGFHRGGDRCGQERPHPRHRLRHRPSCH